MTNNPLSFVDPSGYLSANRDGNESLLESILNQRDGGWINPKAPDFDTLGTGSRVIDHWFNALLSWTSMGRKEMLDTIGGLADLPHLTLASLPRVVASQRHGAPMPKQQLEAAPTGGSTVGGAVLAGAALPIGGRAAARNPYVLGGAIVIGGSLYAVLNYSQTAGFLRRPAYMSGPEYVPPSGPLDIGSGTSPGDPN